MEQEQELDLLALWQVFVKRWKLIVLIPLLALLISAFISLFILTPQYEASTTLMVIKPPETGQIVYQDIQVSRQLVATYREIARSRRVLEGVVDNLSLPYGTGKLREKVDVVAVRDTEIITINVTDPDPALAAAIANEVADAFMKEVVAIMKVENVSLIDQAAQPGAPVSPRVPLNLAVALVIGAMAGVGAAFLLEYLDRSVKDPDEVQKLLEIPVLGIIPYMEDK
ncbi:MAG: capsular biosynthesis protein [Firmicutes bacterium]|nr:capsular biosynthesis protein [Bacillota bacterium]